MKAKLLKRLRRMFIIEYFPSKKLYRLNCAGPKKYFKTESEARNQRTCEILNFGRKHYESYSKSIII